MSTNFTNTTKIEKVLEENSLFVISESKVTFKNCDVVIDLNQISNSRLIKKRDFTANIMVLVFSVLFYVIILQPLYLSTIFESLILALILISVVSCVENYSYKLLINKTNYDFNEIIVSKENLHFAKIFLSKFPASTLLKAKVEQEFEFDYQSLKEA
jgi:glucan phosphoethanolaminetransferase (alkaline phosphatase superfamily)